MRKLAFDASQLPHVQALADFIVYVVLYVMRQRMRNRRWQGNGCDWGRGGVRLQLQPSRDSPHLVVLHRKVLILPLLQLLELPMQLLLLSPPLLLLLLLRWLSESGAASSKRVGVRAGKASGGLRSIAAGINADITRAPSSVATKARSVGCIAMNCELIVLAFKACGRVVVRILDKEQEADGSPAAHPSLSVFSSSIRGSNALVACDLQMSVSTAHSTHTARLQTMQNTRGSSFG